MADVVITGNVVIPAVTITSNIQPGVTIQGSMITTP